MPPPISPALLQRYEAACQALAAGAMLQARGMLEAVLQADPRFAPAHQMLGLCLAQMGDAVGAERALRQAVALDKRQPAGHASLGELLAALNRPREAERAFRAALALDRRWLPAAEGLSRLLIQQGRADEAVQVTLPLAAPPNAPPAALEAHVKALYAAARLEEALAASRRAAAAGSADAIVGTAQLLGETGRPAEAEAAFRAILARQPGDDRARRGLARAVFAQTRDVDAALAALGHGGAPGLIAYRAKLLNHAGRSAEAFAVIGEALRRQPNDPTLHAAAATAAALADAPDAALAHAERALALAPGDEDLQVLRAEACLAAGEGARALRLLGELRQGRPLDQKLIALEALALRMTGDGRYRALYDYDRFVKPYALEPPRGWATLGAFLTDLAAHFHQVHDAMSEPLDQSLRGGSQTDGNLIHSSEPLIEALFAALDRPIAQFIAELGHSDDALAAPFLARNSGGHAYRGAWSVRLRPGGGQHVNHIHAGGWISSAFYIQLPSAMGETGRDGWLQFGQPGAPTRPALPAEHVVKPEPGRLVLFPSYMWHGTVPFGGTEPRLTFAFDIVPAAEPGRPASRRRGA